MEILCCSVPRDALFCIPTHSIFSLRYPQFTPRTMLHGTTQQAPSIGTHARSRWQPDNIGSVASTSTSPVPVLTSILPFLLYRHSRLIQHTWSFVTHISISLFPQSLFEALSFNSFPQLLGTHQSVPLGRRGCTDVTDRIKMFLVLLHQAIFTSAEADRVNTPALSCYQRPGHPCQPRALNRTPVAWSC